MFMRRGEPAATLRSHQIRLPRTTRSQLLAILSREGARTRNVWSGVDSGPTNAARVSPRLDASVGAAIRQHFEVKRTRRAPLIRHARLKFKLRHDRRQRAAGCVLAARVVAVRPAMSRPPFWA